MAKTNVNIVCDINNKPYLNGAELKVLLGVGSDDTFRNWRDLKGLKHIKPGREILYRRTDVDKWLKQFEVEAEVC